MVHIPFCNDPRRVDILDQFEFEGLIFVLKGDNVQVSICKTDNLVIRWQVLSHRILNHLQA